MKSARKKVKLNIATDSNYNEFNGDLPNEDDIVELRNNNIEKAR